MNKIFLSLAIMFSWTMLSAQDALSDFAAKAAASRVAFDYSYTVRGDLRMKGTGHAVVQGDSFMVSGNGMEIRCDGKTRWVADPDGKELVIEAVSGQEGFSVNPALMVVSFGDAFESSPAGDAVFGGRKVKAWSLVPGENDAFRSLLLFFSGDELAGARVTAPDGTVTEFTIVSLTFSDIAGKDEFVFDLSSCDASWVITDLR